MMKMFSRSISLLFWLMAALAVDAAKHMMMMGKGKGKGNSMMSMKSYKGKGTSKGKGTALPRPPLETWVIPPHGANGMNLPAKPDWVLYAILQNTLGLANAQDPAAGDFSGTLSYGTQEDNPVFMDFDRTVQAGSFAFNARFVGSVDLPALITASMTIYYEASTEVAGNLFLQGMQEADYSTSMAIVGGTGLFYGATGQVTSPPIQADEPIPISVYFF